MGVTTSTARPLAPHNFPWLRPLFRSGLPADRTPVLGNILQEEFQFAFCEVSRHLRKFWAQFRVREQTLCPKIYTRTLRGSFGQRPLRTVFRDILSAVDSVVSELVVSSLKLSTT